MNCKEFQAIAIDLARGFPSDDIATEHTLRHLTKCTACRMRLAEERILTLRLHQVSEIFDRASQVSAHVDVAVLKAYEEHKCKNERIAVSGISSRAGFALLATAAAAVLAVLFWFPTQFLRETSTVTEANPVSTESEMSRPIVIEQATPPLVNSVAEPQDSARQVDRSPDRKPDPISPGSELSEASVQLEEAEFIPIPIGNPVWTPSGPVVRVEVSGAVLNSFGFPVPGDLYTRRIRADLMLGEDGLAQAIRFVQ